MSLSKLASRFGVIAGIGCTIHCFFEYVCDFVICSGESYVVKRPWNVTLNIVEFLGESMQPTLYSNNILICSKIAQRLNRFNRNDIVIAMHPNQPRNLICKRIVALPGDVVLMNSTKPAEANAVLTDAETIYITPGSCWLEGDLQFLSAEVHQNIHFVLGDNRVNSTDSRNYGQIPLGLIKSKVLARIWPINEFRIF